MHAALCMRLQTFHILLLILQGAMATQAAQLQAEAAFCVVLESNAAASTQLQDMLRNFEAQCKASVVTLHCCG